MNQWLCIHICSVIWLYMERIFMNIQYMFLFLSKFIQEMYELFHLIVNLCHSNVDLTTGWCVRFQVHPSTWNPIPGGYAAGGFVVLGFISFGFFSYGSWAKNPPCSIGNISINELNLIDFPVRLFFLVQGVMIRLYHYFSSSLIENYV